MGAKITIFVLFTVLTIVAALFWKTTSSEWWGGIFGNMLVGLVTLICVDLLLDLAIARENRPARASAQEASLRVHDHGVRLLFDVYGATYLRGLIPLADHERIANSEKLEDLAPFLAQTPLRAAAFASPEQSALLLLVRGSLALQNEVNLVLATQGPYLDPRVAAALYNVGQSKLVSFTISGVAAGAIPDRFDQETYAEFGKRLAELEAASLAMRIRKREQPRIGAFALLSQPGLWGSRREGPAAGLTE